MSKIRNEPEHTLEELRSALVRRLALSLLLASGLLTWFTLIQWPFPVFLFGLGIALLGMALSTKALLDTRPVLARHLLAWGSVAALLVAMWHYVNPWLPFLALLLVFVNTMLMLGGGMITAGLVGGLVTWLSSMGFRSYPYPELLALLALATAVAWLSVHTLYTAVEWARTTQQRADRLLEESRKRQIELSRTLKSLELMNNLQRRTQYELAIARQQADEARQMKERFAANISHELRTPLNLILGFSEIMHLTPQVYGEMNWPPALRRDVYQIYRSSCYLMEMINDILDLSRFEMTGFTLNKEPTPLAPFLCDTMEIVQDLFRSHPARLETEIDPGLPTLDIDRTRIRQVLINLFNNARRFTKAGVVRLEARVADGEVAISVSDTGIGIPADKLPHLFEEFYQVDYSLRRERDGAGLGLAISKHFVEAHGGRIWAESQPGEGSTFTFTLPIVSRFPAMLKPDNGPWAKPAKPETSPVLLAVEPDPMVAELLSRHLTDYKVIPVQSMDQLADAIATHRPHAVIHNVPPTECSHSPPCPGHVPIIECSLPSRAWAARELSVAGCLTKPITSQQLLQELSRLHDVRDILIIDDDRGFVQLVERVLQASNGGYNLRRAYDGREGLQAMVEHPPDAVLLDLMMPGEDGFRVLEEMRCVPELASIPVVVLTATSYTEDILSKKENKIVIHRPGGLRLAEVLRCLEAALPVLETSYDDEPGEAPSTSVLRALPPTSVKFA